MIESLVGVSMMLGGIILAGVVGVSSQYPQKEKQTVYVCALFFYCLGMVMAEPLATATHANFSLMGYILSSIVFGPIATVLFGSFWGSLSSAFNAFVRRDRKTTG